MITVRMTVQQRDQLHDAAGFAKVSMQVFALSALMKVTEDVFRKRAEAKFAAGLDSSD